mgnify:CR=1 FL=1
MNEMVKEFKDIEISKIHPNEWNPNEQTDNVFNQLVEEIRTDGFDHPLQVVPCSCEKIDGPHYKIIGGEHRFKAVQVLGWEKVPCVIYENWNEELQKLKTVRRNLLSGELNDRKFTDLVRSMKDDNPELTNELLARAMGFDNEQEYAKHLLEVTEREESEGREWLNDMKATGNEVEAVDGLSDILNNIFTQYGCFPPTELVETASGVMEMGLVKAGMHVLTKEGYLQEVEHVFERDFDGHLVEVGFLKDRRPIRATQNHEFFVVRPTRAGAWKLSDGMSVIVEKKRAGDLVPVTYTRNGPSKGDWLVMPRCKDSALPEIEIKASRKLQRDAFCCVEGCGNSSAIKGYCVSHYQRFHRGVDPTKPSRKRGGVQKHTVCSMVGCSCTSVAHGLCARHYAGKERTEEVCGKFQLTEDLAWFIGLYIAEGCRNNNVVRLSLGDHEEYFAKRVLKIVKAVFGLDAKYYFDEVKSTCTVCIPSTSLAMWLEGNCGKGAKNKQIPAVFFYAPTHLRGALLRGIIDGDGYEDGETITVGVISERLVRGIQRLLVRDGVSPSVAYQKPNEKSFGASMMYRVSWSEHPSQNRSRFFDDFIAVPVLSVSKIPYTGKVMNLTVKESHTYQVQGIAVGNSTVPQSFMFFAYKGKTHLAVFMNEELKKKVEGIVEILKKSGQNMNDYLAENIVVKPSNE